MTPCPGCGKPVPFFSSLVHCDPIEPIDDVEEAD